MEFEASTSSYFRYAKEGDSRPSVDEVSCRDLELDKLFCRLDATATTPGRALLYRFLRSPCADEAELEARWSLADALAKEAHFVSRLKKGLASIGSQERGDLADEIWGRQSFAFERYRPLFYGWMAFSMAAIALSIVLGLGGPFVFLGVAIANIIIYSKTTSFISMRSGSIFYLCALIRGGKGLAKSLGTSDSALVGEFARGLDACLRPLRGIPRRALFFQASKGKAGDILDSLLEYLRVFLLQELFAYFKVYRAFEKEGAAIEGLYLAIGRLDASLCLHGLAALGATRIMPESGLRSVEAVDLVHPLVPDCVPNSISFAKGLVITGTNMAGKSTFLKALGISQVLASSLGLAFASSFRTGFFLVISSMTNGDDLAAHKSRYYVEAERMLGIVRAAEAGFPVMALVDEMLVGTNSEDRIYASIRILRRLVAGSSMAVAATHDLAIAQALEGDLPSCHFSELIEDDLVFDYKLKAGIVDKKNALNILRYLGFDEEFLGGPL